MQNFHTLKNGTAQKSFTFPRFKLENYCSLIKVTKIAFQNKSIRLCMKEILGKYLCAVQAIIAASERNYGSYFGLINSTYRTNLIEHSQMVFIQIYSRFRSHNFVIINLNIP